MAINEKLTNVLGVKMPFWIVNQLETRSNKGSLSDRSNNDNLKYLSNKTAWVRLASSIDVSGSQDFSYFQQIDPTIKQPNDLAKNYMLFGGTSKFLKDQSYELRWGLHNVNNQTGGSYGMLGESEVQNYGYRPMPGITRVHIDTQGRLGSVRHATIDIKCWDKAQLDIIDALYFKLGYTMFLEWGHTYYYPNDEPDTTRESLDPNKVLSSEFMSLNPFEPGISKEELNRRISENSRKSYGNYDGMLGIVTNFNFSYNQEGGYDCTVRMMGLGVLGDSIKINNPSKLINLLTDEVLLLKETLEVANPGNSDPVDQKNEEEARKSAEESANEARRNYENLVRDLKELKQQGSTYNVVPGSSLPQQRGQKIDSKLNYFGSYGNFGEVLYLSRLQEIFPLNEDYAKNIDITFDLNYLATSILALDTKRKKAGYPALETGSAWSYRKDLATFDKRSTATYAFNFKDAMRNIEAIDLTYAGSSDEKFTYNIKSTLLADTPTRQQEVQLQDKVLNENKEYYRSPSQQENETTFKVEFAPLNVPTTFQRIKNLVNSDFEGIENVKLEKIEFKPSDLTYPDPSTLDNKPAVKVFFTVGADVLIKDVKTLVKVTNLFQNGTLIPEERIFETKEDAYIRLYITFTDTNIIKSFDASKISGFPVNVQKRAQEVKKQEILEQKRFAEQQKEEEKALLAQINESLGVQSNLEITLRTIQVRALNSAFYQKGINNIDLSIGGKVYALDMTKRLNAADQRFKKTVAETVFSNGVYEDMISDLIKGGIDNSTYFSNEQERLKINAKYGFATTLMGSDSTKDDLFKGLENKEVDYSNLLKAYVIPYEYSSDIVAGIKAIHPVYVPFGLLLMLLNHSCTLYDESSSQPSGNDKEGKKLKKPIVYIDYNDKLNFFQTCPQQMSTNPWIVLTRVECSKEDYRKLFNPEVLKGDKILGLSSAEKNKETGTTPIFDPENMDLLSYQLPPIKTDKKYTGNVMNILLNIDYLIDVIKSNSFKDGTNGVYLKPFLEEVITNVNKYLGNFNAFRLNYSDKANTFQIVDDQYVDTDIDVPVQPKKTNDKNRTELPLVGRFSIAKSLELKTELGSKLANLIAISANSSGDQSQNSTNSDSVGFINDNYVDRIVPKRVGSGGNSTNLNGEKAASQQFNRSIEDFYASIQPSKDDVSQATNFLIEKISNVKNDTPATRATAMIPLGVNFTTDGIAGMSMYQTFTVSDNLLPYTYYSKKSNGFIDGQTTFVGFVVVGLTHTIENNVWNTAVRSNMISVKDKSVFTGEIATPKKKDAQLLGAGPPEVTPNADKLRLKIADLSANYQNRISLLPPSTPYYNQTDKLSMIGDISENLADVAGQIFDFMLKNYTDMKILVGGGNDIFHKNSTNSPHNKGRGLDFTVYPAKYQVRWKPKTSENQPTEERPDLSDPNLKTHRLMDEKLQKFVKEKIGRRVYKESILDEYLYPSPGATDGHYHITTTY